MNNWYIHGEPTDASVNISGAGDNTIVAASSTSQTFIMGLSVIAQGTVTVTVKLGSRTVGVFPLTSGQTINLSPMNSHNGAPWFICEKGEAFILNLSGAIQVAGTVKSALNQP